MTILLLSANDSWIQVGCSFHPPEVFMFDKHDNLFTASARYYYHQATSDKCTVTDNNIVKLYTFRYSKYLKYHDFFE